MNNTKRFFVYARKSTDDPKRQVRSIPDQLAEVRGIAQREGIDMVDVLQESESAKYPGRPVFNKMLERMERGEADGILAWNPDRLSRNSIDSGRLIYLVDQGTIQGLRFPNVTVERNAHGRFMLAVIFGQAKYYSDNLSENIKRGQRQRVLRGIWPMLPPVGFLIDHRTKEIVHDPERAPLIRQAFELYGTGDYTIDALREVMQAAGLTNRRGPSLSRAQMHRALSNPLYCGVIHYGDEIAEGKHEPIVGKQLFDRCQEVIGRKSKPKAPRLKSFLYRGMFCCGECGCFITTETQKGINYLRCTKRVKHDCSQRYVREQEISRQISDTLSKLVLPSNTIDAIGERLQRSERAMTKLIDERVSDLRAQIVDLDEKLKRLTAAYLDRVLSLAEFSQLKDALVQQKLGLREKIKATEASDIGWFEPAIRFVNGLKQATLVASTGNDVQKRDLLKKLGSNFTVAQKRLNLELTEPWKIVENHGCFAHERTAAPFTGATVCGETDHDLKNAVSTRRPSNAVP